MDGEDNSPPDFDFSQPAVRKKSSLSKFQALVHFLKGMVGTGIFTLPFVFMLVGPYLSFLLAMLTFFITYNSNYIFISSSQILCAKENKPSMTYPEITEMAFVHGPKQLKKFSKFFRHLIGTFISLGYLGSCTVYLVTISEFMQQLYKGSDGTMIGIRTCITIVFIPTYLICMIPNLKYLAPLSTLSNLTTFFAIFSTYYYFLEDTSAWHVAPSNITLMHIFDFFGATVFALNSIGVIAAVQTQIHKPKDFFGLNGVLSIGMSIVLVSYMFMGYAGSLRFGLATRDSVILNLPEGSSFSKSVRVMLMCSILLAIGLNFFVPYQVLWNVIEPKVPEKRKRAVHYATKVGLILTFYLLAVLVPSIGPIVTLVGAISFSIIGLVMPAMIQTLVLFNEPNGYGKCNWILWKNLFLILFGLSIFVFGTASSLQNIRQNVYRQQKSVIN